jgi:integrase
MQAFFGPNLFQGVGVNKPKKLTHTSIQNLKPKDKFYRITDNEVEGLAIEVTPQGSKLWRLRYKRGNGKYTMISLGKFPTVSLSSARDKARTKKTQLIQGIDIKKSSDKNFRALYYEWHERNIGRWSTSYAKGMTTRIENNVMPFIGDMQVSDISSIVLLSVLESIEKRGAMEMAHRCRRICEEVFGFALAKRLISNNPAVEIKGLLTPLIKKPFPFPQDIQQIATLIKAINTYSIYTRGSFVTQCALQILSITMLRPGEVRHGLWSEINWDEAEWVISAEKMKMRHKHVVPLPRQAISILKELQNIKGTSNYIFTSSYDKATRPLSENTMNAALRRLDFSADFIVSHSFRKIASTLLNERNWNRDWIERQLAHRDTNRIRDDYNYAQYLPQRRKMLQALADFYDYLKTAEKPSVSNLAIWSED